MKMEKLDLKREDFREFLDRLRAEKELVDIKQPVDIRHIATLVDQAQTALYFHNVIGYDMPVVSGIIRSSRRAALSMGCSGFPEIEYKLQQGIDHPIAPKYVESARCKEVIELDDKVDLFRLPIPMSSIYDGGPMITAGVVIAKDPEHGLNSGMYRFMVKEKNLTGIDIVTPNNMRLFAQRAFEAGRPCPISISIGTHPFEIMGSGFRAPLGVDEMAIAGGIRGAPTELVMCETIDMPCIANAEIVLEAEILPTGWTHPEGRFGEFTRLMGGLHWNPLVKVKAITRRKNAIYYALHMPWENTWLAAPTRYTSLRRALKNAGIQVKDINVTLGGCGFWHAIVSITKQAGEGKNALLAALTAQDIKHVVVVDDDIDVHNAMDVEWAIATRVQGDKDVIIIPGARAKPLDPSLAVTPPGVVPTGAKVGIDATIGEGIPRERFERIAYAYADRAKIADYVKGKADAPPATTGHNEALVERLASAIMKLIDSEPRYYQEIAQHFGDHEFQTIARALGKLHTDEKLWQDARGRVCLKGSAFAAKPPSTGGE
jgi:2,5-furandicarboxylate decarboxylase 1